MFLKFSVDSVMQSFLDDDFRIKSFSYFCENQMLFKTLYLWQNRVYVLIISDEIIAAAQY